MMTQTTNRTNGNTPKPTKGQEPQTAISTTQTQPTQTPAQLNTQTNGAPVVEMHDAPYSWTLTAIDEGGFSEMFTVRAVTEKGFFERIARTKTQLIAQNYKPAPTRSTTASTHTTNEQAPMCGIHKEPMQRKQGKNGSFWACQHKLDNGEYCPYRPKQ